MRHDVGHPGRHPCLDAVAPAHANTWTRDGRAGSRQVVSDRSQAELRQVVGVAILFGTTVAANATPPVELLSNLADWRNVTELS